MEKLTHRPIPTDLSSDPSSPIRIKRSQNPEGEGGFHFEGDHTLSMSLVSRPIRYLQIQDGKAHTGLYRKGDFSLTPANLPFFARWEGDEDYLQIRIKAQFVRDVALETLDRDGDRLELRPGFRIRDPHIEAIGTLCLSELQQSPSHSKLYMDSLANVLAVNLLRQYTTIRTQLPVYEGGLPQGQLRQVLDYIDAHWNQDINLVDLAQLLDMSQFHFSHLFKQSLGISPYRYLIQQRIERAKVFLKQSDQPIMDIALACGFSSHSHLSKQFRQLTGMTPTAYRAH